MLYIAAAIGGVGAGAVYGTCIGNALKWFPDRRGLCAGLTAAGFGAGSALTIIPIQQVIRRTATKRRSCGSASARGSSSSLLSLLLRAPQPGETPAPHRRGCSRPRATTRPPKWCSSPVFWVMYVMFVLVGAGGLMATAQLAPIAKDFKIDEVPVSLIGLTLPALTFALVDRPHPERHDPAVLRLGVGQYRAREHDADRLRARGGRHLGAERFGQDPVMFVILSGLVFFAWGEIYSLFPSTCTDIYGVKYATTNAGLLYTAKGTASLLVPFGNVLAQATGSWHTVFIVAAIMNLLAALAAPFVLRPLRMRHQAALAARAPTARQQPA